MSKFKLIAMAATLASLAIICASGPVGRAQAGGGKMKLVATVPLNLEDAIATAVNPVTNRVYLPSHDFYARRVVKVIDGSSNTVVAVIPVNILDMTCVAVNTATNRIYVGDGSADTPGLTVIDGASDTVVATIPTFTLPRSVAVNPTTNRIYVYGPALGDSSVDVVDGASNTVLTTLHTTLSTQYGTGGIAVNPVTNRVYAAGVRTGVVTSLGPAVVVFNGSNNLLEAIIEMSSYPRNVAVNATTNRVYTVSDNIVSVIDGFSNTVVATVQAGVFSDTHYPSMPAQNGPPSGVIGVSETTNRIYLAGFLDPDTWRPGVTYIDGAANTAGEILETGLEPAAGLAVNPATNRIYVTGLSRVITDRAAVVVEHRPHGR